MKKQYMIGEKNGQKFVAHATRLDILDGAVEITKAEYRRHRAAGIPSWGEAQTVNAKAQSRNPKRAARWAARAAAGHVEAMKMERERMNNWKLRQEQAAMKNGQRGER